MGPVENVQKAVEGREGTPFKGQRPTSPLLALSHLPRVRREPIQLGGFIPGQQRKGPLFHYPPPTLDSQREYTLSGL